jgi:hypothetical protein
MIIKVLNSSTQIRASLPLKSSSTSLLALGNTKVSSERYELEEVYIACSLLALVYCSAETAVGYRR